MFLTIGLSFHCFTIFLNLWTLLVIVDGCDMWLFSQKTDSIDKDNNNSLCNLINRLILIWCDAISEDPGSILSYIPENFPGTIGFRIGSTQPREDNINCMIWEDAKSC